jgi:hypothetical protein
MGGLRLRHRRNDLGGEKPAICEPVRQPPLGAGRGRRHCHRVAFNGAGVWWTSTIASRGADLYWQGMIDAIKVQADTNENWRKA